MWSKVSCLRKQHDIRSNDHSETSKQCTLRGNVCCPGTITDIETIIVINQAQTEGTSVPPHHSQFYFFPSKGNIYYCNTWIEKIKLSIICESMIPVSCRLPKLSAIH